jgi:molybdopterin-guanine dinucleotide biosynthesis protein
MYQLQRGECGKQWDSSTIQLEFFISEKKIDNPKYEYMHCKLTFWPNPKYMDLKLTFWANPKHIHFKLISWPNPKHCIVNSFLDRTQNICIVNSFPDRSQNICIVNSFSDRTQNICIVNSFSDRTQNICIVNSFSDRTKNICIVNSFSDRTQNICIVNSFSDRTQNICIVNSFSHQTPSLTAQLSRLENKKMQYHQTAEIQIFLHEKCDAKNNKDATVSNFTCRRARDPAEIAVSVFLLTNTTQPHSLNYIRVYKCPSKNSTKRFPALRYTWYSNQTYDLQLIRATVRLVTGIKMRYLRFTAPKHVLR